MADDLQCYNISDLRDKARRRLPKGVWEFIERGVEDETGMARNRDGFSRLTFRTRVARNVEKIDLSTCILGEERALPFAIAPTGGAGMLWYHGDLELARAAAKADIPFTISSASTMDVEEIAKSNARLWFQLYLWEDRELSYNVMERAHNAGCEALMVTMDMATPPNREYLHRNGFNIPFKLNWTNFTDIITHPRWLLGMVAKYYLREGGIPSQANLPPHLQQSLSNRGMPGAMFKLDNVDWEELEQLRAKWPGKFILKGILHPDDARRAVDIGADAILVSNHGGRSLDFVCSTIDALPEIVEAVGGRLDVLLDSGVRRGSDIVKARALGADGVMVGRASLYGLAAAGQAGASRAIEILAAEVAQTMALLGVNSSADIDHEVLFKR